jgi:hypothetical protein
MGMFCAKCGSKNNGEHGFCFKCGNPINNRVRTNNVADNAQGFVSKSTEQQYATQHYTMPPPTIESPELIVTKKRTANRSVILAVVTSVMATLLMVAILYYFLDIGARDTIDSRIEGSGFASGEDAVSAYLEAFKNGDIDGMISTFAIETHIENLDLEVSVERASSNQMIFSLRHLSDNQFIIGLNTKQRQGFIADSIGSMYMSLFLPDALNEGRTLYFNDNQEMLSFIRMMQDQSQSGYLSMGTITFLDFVPPSRLDNMYTYETTQQRNDEISDVLGADDFKSVVARVDIDNQTFLFCFGVVRHGDSWYINSLGGTIGTLLGIPHFAGGVIPEAEVDLLRVPNPTSEEPVVITELEPKPEPEEPVVVTEPEPESEPEEPVDLIEPE